MLKIFKQASMVLLAVAALLFWLPSSAHAVTYTGCLTNAGSIIKMQAGDLPTSPCNASQEQISLHSGGPQGPGGGGTFEFVGYSNNAVDGSVGFDGMTAECVATFDDDARFSTTEEYIKSKLIARPATPAWINPVLIGLFNDPIDYSSFKGSLSEPGYTWNCRQWISSSLVFEERGTVVDPNGTIDSEPCDTSNVVACSAAAL